MPDPVVIVDSKGIFLEVNDKVKEATGFEKEELLGKSFLGTKIVTEKSKAILAKNLTKRMLGISITPYEVEVLTKDGRKIPFEVNATKIEYEGKTADFVILRDIMQRKKAEELHRSVVELSPDSIITVDMKEY
jgi:PAS domain S-box-containing protein